MAASNDTNSNSKKDKTEEKPEPITKQQLHCALFSVCVISLMLLMFAGVGMINLGPVGRQFSVKNILALYAYNLQTNAYERTYNEYRATYAFINVKVYDFLPKTLDPDIIYKLEKGLGDYEWEPHSKINIKTGDVEHMKKEL